MRKFKKCLISLLTLSYLFNFVCMNGFIHASEIKTAMIDVEFTEQLNEAKDEADLILNLIYDEKEIQLNKIINPDKSETTLINYAYHVQENNTYNFEVQYTILTSQEIVSEYFSYELKTLNNLEDTKPESKVEETEPESGVEDPKPESGVEDPKPDSEIEVTKPETELKVDTITEEQTKLENTVSTIVTFESDSNNTDTAADTINQYTVEFNSKEGSLVESQIIDEGNHVTKPNNPTKVGYIFKGWFIDESMTTEWVFENDIVHSNITLYAKWTPTTKVSSNPNLMFWNETAKGALKPLPYSGEQDWVGNKLYWGVNGSNPMKWRILNTNESSFGQSSGFLIMHDDANQLSTTDVIFNTAGSGNAFATSSLSNFIYSKYTSTLTSLEQRATLASSKSESGYQISGITNQYVDNFSERSWFVPTARMLTNESYGFSNSSELSQTRNLGSNFWMSSVYTNDNTVAGAVTANGEITDASISSTARPVAASQLDSKAIQFVSKAVGDINSEVVEEGVLAPVGINDSGEYKLTLKDSSQVIVISSAYVDEANVATINYNKKGNGTTLKAIITDNAGTNIISYGQIASFAAGVIDNLTATVQLPNDFFTQGYKLKIYTELNNGDKKTNFASEINDTDVREYQPMTSPKAGFVFWDADTKEKLNPPTYSGNKEWTGSKLYWGTNGSTPMKWRILNTNETELGQDAGILIMQDDVTQLNSGFMKFNTSGIGNAYMGSSLATYIDDKSNLSLNANEKEATLASSRNETNYSVLDETGKYKDNFSDKKWFAPTARMMFSEEYGFQKTLTANNTRKFGNAFWLSSSHNYSSNSVGAVYNDGSILNYNNSSESLVIGASQLNPNSILFVSNAEGGKISGPVGEKALTPINPVASGEYILTLKDTTQTLTITSSFVDTLNIATINYNKTGNGTRLSAIVTDSTGENIISYGRIAVVNVGDLNDQTAKIQLPNDFFSNGYKLKLFTEVYSGDKKTDFASAIVDVELKEYQLSNYANGGIAFWNADTKEKLNPTIPSEDNGWIGSKLFWGSNAGIPMKWRILNTKETDYGQENGLLLMHDDTIQMSTERIDFNSAGSSTSYTGSGLASFIDGKYNELLTTKEKNATLASTRVEESYSFEGYSDRYLDNFSNKKWFVPTIRMVATEKYGYAFTKKNPRRLGHDFWISTSNVYNPRNTFIIDELGAFFTSASIAEKRVVGATQLDSNAILLVSDAVGGKISGPIGENSLMPVSDKGSGEYKLTLNDTSQTVTVNTAYMSDQNVATIFLHKQGDGTKLSAIVTDSTGEKIISYGELMSLMAGSWTKTATVKLPSDFFSKGYKLKIFTETNNGDKKTDYASKIVDVELREYQAVSKPKSGLVFWNEETKEGLKPLAYRGEEPWAGSKLYWGVNGSTPMKWRILNPMESKYGQTEGVLIMHDSAKEITTETMKFNNNGVGNSYMNSDLSVYLDSQFSNLLNVNEQNATLSSSKIENNYLLNDSMYYYKDNFSDKKWFAPTARMLTTENYGYRNSVIGNLERHYEVDYWLSSSNSYNNNSVGVVTNMQGRMSTYTSDTMIQVVGTTQLDPNQILFVSNAEGGKNNDVIGKDALTAVPSTASGEYKFTLKDSNQTVNVTSSHLNTSMLATIKYEKTGPGTILSAIVTDSLGNDIIAYGQIAAIPEGDLQNQTVTIQLPEDFVSKEYRLKILTEIYVGDKKTDYASNPVDTNAELEKFTVTFDSKGGTNVENLIIVDGNKITKPKDPTKEGYRFNGWYLDEEYTNVWTFDNDIVSSNMTLYAKWDKLYYLNFDANTGEGTMESVEFIMGETLTLPKNTFTKDNYGFSGWNTNADGSGTSYDDEAILSDMLDSDLTLYATWNVQVATVFIDIPSGISLMNNREEKVATKEVTVNIVKDPIDAAWYPDQDIQIRTNPNITLTNIFKSYSYEVELFKADNTKYTDASTPLAILNVKDENQQSSKFTLKTPMNFMKPKGTYIGIMDFIIEFAPNP